MNKSLSYVNLGLELHIVSTFDWDLIHQGLFLYILPSHHHMKHMNLRDEPLEDTHTLSAELTFVDAHFLQKYP